MKILGIIAEFNPFHNGHKYAIDSAVNELSPSCVVAIMGGSFLQRGEPAIMDKWQRTKACLLCGVDIVIELPTVFGTSSAEFFARGAVNLLHKTNFVTDLCFGSEHGELDGLFKLAKLLSCESLEFSSRLGECMDKGLTFAKARQISLMDTYRLPECDAALLTMPNNILAIEYLKALLYYKSSITPHTVKRYKASHHQQEICGDISSASAIRNSVTCGDLSAVSRAMPLASYEVLKQALDDGIAPVCINDFSTALHYRLLQSECNLSDVADYGEGLENRMTEKSRNAFYISELVREVKSKRYTATRIQRAILHTLIGLKKSDMASFTSKINDAGYIRILGYRREKKEFLQILARNCSIPLVVNVAGGEKILNSLDKKMLSYDFLSTDLYMLHLPNVDKRKKGMDYTQPIIIV